MALACVILLIVILVCLGAERRRALRDREKLSHVIHVNGIRGKSTVTRLIDAGLRAARLGCRAEPATGKAAWTL